MAATIKDIARRTGLGLATISKYINGGNVLPKNREAIEDAIRALDFKVNETARNLKTRHTGYVGLVMPALTNSFIMQIIQQIQFRQERLLRLLQLQQQLLLFLLFLLDVQWF